MDKSADLFKETYPFTAEQSKKGLYGNNLGMVKESLEEPRERTREADKILVHAGMKVQTLFDPMGFLTPVLLHGKILLRKTWENPCDKLGWDDDLPLALKEEIFQFFVDLFQLEELEFLN